MENLIFLSRLGYISSGGAFLTPIYVPRGDFEVGRYSTNRHQLVHQLSDSSRMQPDLPKNSNRGLALFIMQQVCKGGRVTVVTIYKYKEQRVRSVWFPFVKEKSYNKVG